MGQKTVWPLPEGDHPRGQTLVHDECSDLVRTCRCCPCNLFYVFYVDAKPLGYALPIGRIGSVEMLQLANLNIAADRFHVLHKVVNKSCFLVWCHQAEQIPRLRIVICILAVVVSVPHSTYGEIVGNLAVNVVLHWTIGTVRLVVHISCAIIVEPHSAVSLVVSDLRGVWAVDRKELVIDPQPVAMRVRICEDSHL